MNWIVGCIAAITFSWAVIRQVALPRHLAYAAAPLGMLAVLSASWVIGLFFGIPVVGIDVALLVAGLALIAITPVRLRREFVSGGSPLLKVAFVVGCAVAASALIAHMLRFPDGGNDAFIIWNLRARWLFRAGSDFHSAFSPRILFWTHQDYPLLLPALVARAFDLLGHESAAVPAVIAFVFTAASVGVVFAGAPATGRWLSALAVVTTPALVMQGATEQADLPLAAFLGAATAILIAREHGDQRAIALAGAFASMAAWTKNEGSLHLLLMAAAVMLDERRARAALAFFLGALPLLALLAFFKFSYATRNDLLQMSLAPALARAMSPDRWSALVPLLLRRIVLLQAWGLHLAGLVVWFAIFRRLTAKRPHLYWLSWVPFTTMATHLCILLCQPHDLVFMFKVTIDRLLIQIWPSILLLLSWRVPAREAYLVGASA
jgi:hypothetical protein